MNESSPPLPSLSPWEELWFLEEPILPSFVLTEHSSFVLTKHSGDSNS